MIGDNFDLYNRYERTQYLRERHMVKCSLCDCKVEREDTVDFEGSAICSDCVDKLKEWFADD